MTFEITLFEAVALFSVVLIHFLNTYVTNNEVQRPLSKEFKKAFSLDESSPSKNTAFIINKTTGNYQNQQSEIGEDNIELIQYENEDNLQEEEDSLSLDNLFPCNQTVLYGSIKIHYIISELLTTERNYVNNLKKGISNYGHLYKIKSNLPGSRLQLLGNIDDILELHEQKIFPLMIRNRHDLISLFDELTAYFEKNYFYCYVIYMMNKRASIALRQDLKGMLEDLQCELNDKLGIDSFLVQPIQRLTRYPLLLEQLISEFYKSGINCKVLIKVCRLEARMRRFLEVVNQAEEISAIEELHDFNLKNYGNFCKSTVFDVFHHRLRKKFRAKIFVFEKCLLCTEIRKKRLFYRFHYLWTSVELHLTTSKSVTVLIKAGNKNQLPELALSTPVSTTIHQWFHFVSKIIFRDRLSQQGKISVPSSLVLIVLSLIWLLWQFINY